MFAYCTQPQPTPVPSPYTHPPIQRPPFAKTAEVNGSHTDNSKDEFHHRIANEPTNQQDHVVLDPDSYVPVTVDNTSHIVYQLKYTYPNRFVLINTATNTYRIIDDGELLMLLTPYEKAHICPCCQKPLTARGQPPTKFWGCSSYDPAQAKVCGHHRPADMCVFKLYRPGVGQMSDTAILKGICVLLPGYVPRTATTPSATVQQLLDDVAQRLRTADVPTTALTATTTQTNLLATLQLQSVHTRLNKATYKKACTFLAHKAVLPAVKQLRPDHPVAVRLWKEYCAQREVARVVRMKKRSRTELEGGDANEED